MNEHKQLLLEPKILSFSTINEACKHLPEEEVANTVKDRRDLCGITIDAAVSESIWKAVVSNQGIVGVIFENMDVESERVAELLRELKHLKSIYFKGTEDGSTLMKVDNVDILREAFAEHEGLEHIVLVNVQFGDAVIEAVAESTSVRLSLKRLVISEGKVSQDSFHTLAKALPQFVSLQSLAVKDIKDSDLVVNDDSASAVFHAIKSNDMLKTLQLVLNTNIVCSYKLFNAFMTSNTLENAKLICFLPPMDLGVSLPFSAVEFTKLDGRIKSVILRGPNFFTMLPDNDSDTSWGGIDIHMAPFVADKSPTALSLDGWSLSPRDTRRLCTDLVASDTTEILSLGCCQIGSEDHIVSLGRMLSTFPKLTALNLANNEISGDMVVLLCNTVVRNDTLGTLILVGNSIQDHGAMALAECLVNGKLSLTTLIIMGAEIGDKGFKAIANSLTESTVRLDCLEFDTEECASDAVYESLGNALKVNTTLKRLQVHGNSTAATTRKGARALLDGVKVHPALTKLVVPDGFFTNLEQDELDLYLELNKGARRLLQQSTPLQLNLWPRVLKKANDCRNKSPGRGQRPLDLLYYFVKEKCELFANAASSLRKHPREEQPQAVQAPNKRQETSC